MQEIYKCRKYIQIQETYMNVGNIYEYRKHMNDINAEKKGSNFITDCVWLNL